MQPVSIRRIPATCAALLAAAACLPAMAQARPAQVPAPKTVIAPKPVASPPSPITLTTGWEIRDLYVPPAPPQPPPPTESGSANQQPTTPAPTRLPFNPNWRPTTVPDIFDPDASPELYGGSAKEYRLRFVAPSTRSFGWAFRFEESRRRTVVLLNGRRIGASIDPYSPFQIPASGIRPGKLNELKVIVDSRKDPRLPEGWWNWGGIVRPVHLVPMGSPSIEDIGLLSDVSCRGPATNCRAAIKLDGILSKLPPAKRRRRVTVRTLLPPAQPSLRLTITSPLGRVTTKTFALKGYRGGRVRINKFSMPVPAPQLWSPDRPQLYDATATLIYDNTRQQVDRKKIGLRSVKVVDGLLRLNNRPINLRGASIHEDMPGHGAALTGSDMDTIVRELKEVGANVTRAHYLMSEGLLERFDRAGIMVWNQVPVWQRDHGANLLSIPSERSKAVLEVQRGVKGARNHPSVITHSVANELTFRPDAKTGSRLFLNSASNAARDLDPTLPISIDIKTNPGYEEQFTYERFDMIGLNEYFGWYQPVTDFNGLEPYLNEIHNLYPSKALVVTEFGAEGRPDLNQYPDSEKGTYAFQTMHVARTLDVLDRTPFLSGSIHWTLREFEIYPSWLGGIERVPPGRNTRHYKGLLTYHGEKKPVWQVVHDHFVRTPLYR